MARIQLRKKKKYLIVLLVFMVAISVIFRFFVNPLTLEVETIKLEPSLIEVPSNPQERKVMLATLQDQLASGKTIKLKFKSHVQSGSIDDYAVLQGKEIILYHDTRNAPGLKNITKTVLKHPFININGEDICFEEVDLAKGTTTPYCFPNSTK